MMCYRGSIRRSTFPSLTPMEKFHYQQLARPYERVQTSILQDLLRVVTLTITSLTRGYYN